MSENEVKKPYERPKPHPASYCDGDCIHCKMIEECEAFDREHNHNGE